MRHKTGFLVASVVDVVQPFSVKLCHVKIKNGRFNQKLTVAGITEALPVWAIAAVTAVKIAELRPDVVFINFIKQFIRACKMPDRIDGRIYNLAFYAVECQLNRRAAHLYLPKSVPGKPRFINFLATTLEEINILLSVVAVHLFKIAEHNFCSSFAFNF